MNYICFKKIALNQAVIGIFSLQGDKGDMKVSESQDAHAFSNRFLLFKETTQGCFSDS